MKCYQKYQRQYKLPNPVDFSWMQKDHVDRAPVWCSVDLRDGNQALIEPMNIRAKTEFFKLLVDLGFKEIEVGFPASSDAEYDFIRMLIEENLIPDDVEIQVLTSAKEKIIRRTFECIEGAKKVTVNMYSPVSPVQRKRVFGVGMSEMKKVAVEAATLMQELKKEGMRFEYIPESFTVTEPEFALEVCNAVLDVWKPTKENPAIITLPATLEVSAPHVFGAQVHYIRRNLKYSDGVVLSVHPHNDRGTAVAAAEAALLAGATRVEGTLFGNGERTGNVDLVTMALNLYTQGVDPALDFSNLPYAVSLYRYFTGMKVPPRHPYAGSLVFAAFSGTHQDAITKAMKHRKENDPEGVWDIPYLPVDPDDLGRNYEKEVIRINSQSGKGGVGYLLERDYELTLPRKLKEAFVSEVKAASLAGGAEFSSDELYGLFCKTYMDHEERFALKEIDYKLSGNGIEAIVSLRDKKTGKTEILQGAGNGRIDAVAKAVREHYGIAYIVNDYAQHILSEGSSSKAMAYISIRVAGQSYWGAGIHDDSTTAAIKALSSALNSYFAKA